MASALRYSAVVAMISSVAGKSFGSMPVQTGGAGGYGVPVFEAMPTQAPSLELVKRKLEKKALTNVCSEWTILGGNGQPQCYASQTCLFSSVGDFFYEGCGQTSIAYDWITECYNYPKSGNPGPSQTFCDSAYPYCGVFEFVQAPGYTYSNFGCATESYSYIATLLDTTSDVEIAVGGTTKSTFTPTKTVIITKTPTDTNPTDIPGRTTRSASPLPQPITRKKKAPIGAIVGGVVGGIAVIALLMFIAWYCLKKRKQDKDNAAAAGMTQQQQADAATAAAYHNTARMPEIDGTMTSKPPVAGAGAFQTQQVYSQQPEKPIAGVAANEYRPQPQTQYSSGYGSEMTDARSTTASPPPPFYNQPPPAPVSQVSSPASHYTELDPSQTVRAPSVPPVSPVPTTTNTFLSANVSELGGGENRMSYQAYHPPTDAPPIPSMTGGINSPVQRQQPTVDMNGAPMSENYRPHEMP